MKCENFLHAFIIANECLCSFDDVWTPLESDSLLDPLRVRKHQPAIAILFTQSPALSKTCNGYQEVTQIAQTPSTNKHQGTNKANMSKRKAQPIANSHWQRTTKKTTADDANGKYEKIFGPDGDSKKNDDK